MIAIIDDNDSFAYNIVQLAGALGAKPVVLSHNALAADDALEKMQLHGIIVASGVVGADRSGVDGALVKRWAERVPVLGIGAGHHYIAISFGAELVPLIEPLHGKLCRIVHDGRRLFAGVPLPLTATRYDSFVVREDSLPNSFVVTARTENDGTVMGVRHTTLPIESIQFHPESAFTEYGEQLMKNFLAMTDTVRAA